MENNKKKSGAFHENLSGIKPSDIIRRCLRTSLELYSFPSRQNLVQNPSQASICTLLIFISFFFFFLTIFTSRSQWTRSSLGEQLPQLRIFFGDWFGTVGGFLCSGNWQQCQSYITMPVNRRISICFVLISLSLPLSGAQFEKRKRTL